MSAAAAAITRIVESVKPLAESYLPDAYVIERDTRTPDGAGGSVVTVDEVETGRCLIRPGGTRPEERVIADRRGYQVPMLALVADDTEAAADDRLIVGARSFEIGGVLRAGAWNVLTRLVMEERSN